MNHMKVYIWEHIGSHDFIRTTHIIIMSRTPPEGE